MPNNDYANEPNQSRSEDIIQSILDNTEYDEAARSRIEYLLIELKNAIEGGGGGGGVTSYSPLTEKPKIDNHTLQAGNNSSSDLGLQTKLTFDSAPTENSTNPVTSGGVYTALGAKANSSDVYNKSAVDTALTAKADKSTTYTKTEVDTALSSKQNTISDLSTIRSGAALGATAVQPVSGKGLSTNDYTTDEKNKLAGIEAQANKTTVDSALSGTSTNPVQNKVVKSALDGKQASLTTAQLAAVNSGADSTKVEQITTNKNNITLVADQSITYNRLNHAASSKTENNVTFTVNSDKSITVSTNGAASGNTVLVLTDYMLTADYTNNKIVGVPVGSTFDSCMYVAYSNNGASEASTSRLYDGGSTSISVNTTYTYFRIYIFIKSGITISNAITFKPMIIPLEVYNAGFTDYQPYALSNVELTAKEQTNENDISLTYGGIVGKNVAKENNISFTLNRAIYCRHISGEIHVQISNIVSTDTDSNICLFILNYTDGTNSGTTYSFTRGANDINIDIGSKILDRITIYASDNYAHSQGDTVTVSDLMICAQVDYTADPSYQQYVMSNLELTEQNKNNFPLILDANGQKNLVDPTRLVFTENLTGVTVTINPDKSITLNGTSSASSNQIYAGVIIKALSPNTTYFLKGTNSTETKFQVCCWNQPDLSDIQLLSNTGDDNTFTTSATPYANWNFRLWIKGKPSTGTQFNNLTVFPYLTLKALNDIYPAYQPYSLPNTEITSALEECVDNGAKNYASINAVTSVANYVDVPINIKAGTYVLSVGSLSSTASSNTNCRIGFYKTPTNVLLDWIDIGTNKSVTINIPSECDTLRIFAGNTTSITSGYSVTFTNLMLCKESEWNASPTYQPYALSNAGLTATKISEYTASVTITLAVAETYEGGTVYNGYSGNDFPSGLAGLYIAVTTHKSGNLNAPRKIQEFVFQTGERMLRYYDGTRWSSLV